MRVVSSTRRSTAGRVECVPVSSLHHLARACDETFDFARHWEPLLRPCPQLTSIPKSVSDARLVVAFPFGVYLVALTFPAQVSSRVDASL